MEIYSDNNLDLSVKRFCILSLFVCFLPFQVAYTIGSEYYISKTYCWAMLLITSSVTLCSFTRFGIDFIQKKLEFGFVFFLSIIFHFSVFIIEPVIVRSKDIFDIHFYMFSSLIAVNIFGVFSGFVFSDRNNFNNKKNIIVRGNEIEIRASDVFGLISLNRMPFLRKPLKKIRNALVIVGFLIGSSGAGIAMGMAEVLKRSDIISPEVGVHAVGFFSIGMPVLFTFGMLTYSMVAYYLEWRKLIAEIEKDFGEHKIIYNFQKKPYKKIREILDRGDKET
ncbi:hypothetical protein HB762_24000 [Vibrio campbellii]|uniref:MotA/TolQ/ExbB proton channel domain-containing protein n=1 Tax=Vibrio campbellii TaxID=680 RepID=A0ABY5IJ07_9VIBR|nr:hypothetical protein [Vibrio campbellii]UTZ34267.1 hypothetical protein HB762_24000 [Vibrio campbellii]